jgi:hypothetical protein
MRALINQALQGSIFRKVNRQNVSGIVNKWMDMGRI